MKIGIFGGSFNPPHYMHLDIAQSLINGGYLDKVIYIPTGDSYNKKGLIDFNDRYNMLKLIIKNNSKLYLSDLGNKKDYEYTYQVLDYFKKNNPYDDIYFICGTDNLNEFEMWKRYEYILENYKLLVIKRNDDNLDDILMDINSQNIVVANIELDNISSTYIRKNIIKGNQKIIKYVDPCVLDYMNKNKCY